MTIPPEALALLGTGTKWLAGAGASVYAAWRILAHDRTLLYALLPKLGKNVDARKMKETIVAASQTAYATELKSLVKQTGLLTQKFLKAKPPQRVLIQRDLEYIEGRKREVEAKFAAMNDIAADATKGDSKKEAKQAEAISGHWMDQFDELVRRRNEEWRALLLKDALVREAKQPGSIAPRVLWLIGILESEKFDVFSALLDLATSVNGEPVIPCGTMRNDGKIVPGLEKMEMDMAMAAIALEDTGLMADSKVCYWFGNAKPVVASYDQKQIEVKPLGLNGNILGIMFSGVGRAVASLYKATPNAFGRELFDRWVTEMNPSQYAIKRF